MIYGDSQFAFFSNRALWGDFPIQSRKWQVGVIFVWQADAWQAKCKANQGNFVCGAILYPRVPRSTMRAIMEQANCKSSSYW